MPIVMSKKLIFSAAAVLIIIGVFIFLFRAPGGADGETVHLVIPLAAEGDRETVKESLRYLHEQGVIRSETALYFLLAISRMSNRIESGAYILAKGWNVFKVLEKLKNPDEVWIVIPEGLRKEEIAEIFAGRFGWSDEERGKWITEYTAAKADYVEGVYSPDTYLIPVDDEPAKVAERLLNRFNEKLAPYTDELAKENVKWTTALKIASIVQREAADKDDMPLIAGVIWNRLLSDTKLDIDATVQYARGDTGSGWWAPIRPEDKNIDSPYNTYLYKGLPPRPIANPGINAIEAVLHPEETKCFYYLHGNDRQIHCAVTYEEHLENINKYLK